VGFPEGFLFAFREISIAVEQAAAAAVKERNGHAAWSERTRGAAADLFRSDGGRDAVLERFLFRETKIASRSLGKAGTSTRLRWNVGDERARQDVAVLFLGEMREHHLGRRPASSRR